MRIILLVLVYKNTKKKHFGNKINKINLFGNILSPFQLPQTQIYFPSLPYRPSYKEKSS